MNATITYSTPYGVIGRILDIFEQASNLAPDDELGITLDNSVAGKTFAPMHIATLACFIEKATLNGTKVRVRIKGNEAFANAVMPENWNCPQNANCHDSSAESRIWLIKQEEIEAYAEQMYQSIKNGKFQQKDLSAIKNSMLEIFYNIFDHANANGLAFSMLRANPLSGKIEFAACDLGIGIVNSVRKIHPNITDAHAITLAAKNGFSIRSKAHNMGYGINNIECACTEDDEFLLISNGISRLTKNGNVEIRPTNFFFPGTIVSFESNMNNLPDEEIIDCFVL